MGTIKSGILGAFSGKVGTVIGGVWKGIAYMRSIAASVTNPNTPAQLEQRAKFAAIVRFLKPLTAILREGFKDLAIKMSGFNAAVKANIKVAIMGAYPAFDIDYTKVVVSVGKLPGAANPLAVAGIAGAVNVTWDNNTWETGALATDNAFIVVINPAKEAAVSFKGLITRAIGHQTFTLPNAYTGDEVQVYISMVSDKGIFSKSQYVSGLIVT